MEWGGTYGAARLQIPVRVRAAGKSIMENGEIIRYMGGERISGLMEGNIKGSGAIIKCVELASTIGMMESSL